MMSWIRRILSFLRVKKVEKSVGQPIIKELEPSKELTKPVIRFEPEPKVTSKKYLYPCEEIPNGDGTVTLEATFVDCAGTAIIGRKDKTRVCVKVVEYAIVLSEEQGFPLIFWTGGDPYDYKSLLRSAGYNFPVCKKIDRWDCDPNLPKDHVAIMIDDILEKYVATRCEVIPEEYHCAYDICPEHIREID